MTLQEHTMYSINNEGKSVVAVRFIRTLKDTIYKFYKFMTSKSKNVYNDKLDVIVNKYNNKYHRTIKMKSADVKRTITARKTIFPRSWNIIESSKRPCKYHLSNNFLAEKKTVFPITKKFKTRTSQ